MRDKFDRARFFVYKNRVVIACTVGYISGAAIGASYMRSSMNKTIPSLLEIRTDATIDMLKETLDEVRERGAPGIMLNDRTNNASIRLIPSDAVSK